MKQRNGIPNLIELNKNLVSFNGRKVFLLPEVWYASTYFSHD